MLQHLVLFIYCYPYGYVYSSWALILEIVGTYFLEQVGKHVATSVAVKGLSPAASLPKRKDQPTAQSGLPWTEKHRPKVPTDIVGNQSVVCWVLSAVILALLSKDIPLCKDLSI